MTRTARPMVELTGTVSDLREGDYVDELGGNGFQKKKVGALVHHIEHLPEQHLSTHFMDGPYGAIFANMGRPLEDVSYVNKAAVSVEFLTLGSFHFVPEAPVRFRRFTD